MNCPFFESVRPYWYTGSKKWYNIVDFDNADIRPTEAEKHNENV